MVSAGARPKILVSISSDEKLEVTQSNPKISHDNWLLNLDLRLILKILGVLICLQFNGKEAGLDVPEAKFSNQKMRWLFPSKKDLIVKNHHSYTCTRLLAYFMLIIEYLVLIMKLIKGNQIFN